MSNFNQITFPPELLDDPVMAGKFADMLIGSETATQDRMWGNANERADANSGQLLGAACAQASFILGITVEGDKADREEWLKIAEEEFYPDSWNGFRDYGSDIANLVVAAAFIRNEVKRRLMKGESHFRAPRPADKPYTGDTPKEPA